LHRIIARHVDAVAVVFDLEGYVTIRAKADSGVARLCVLLHVPERLVGDAIQRARCARRELGIEETGIDSDPERRPASHSARERFYRIGQSEFLERAGIQHLGDAPHLVSHLLQRLADPLEQRSVRKIVARSARRLDLKRDSGEGLRE
jgi:hypothetical protein